jgi:glycosyltransferase involved in cell wall biosynthesis
VLSILIPVYNVDVRDFVSALRQQCVDSGVVFEIICLDDGSELKYKTENRHLAGVKGLHYQELSQNIGRAAIRNRLAEMAAHRFLLFMDCDGAIVRHDFIQTYLQCLDENTVICGGRTYASAKPDNPNCLLHWKYGRKREALPAAQRAVAPWHAFMTNNFVIPRQHFLNIRLDERLRHYGHEDTLLGMELFRRGIQVRHIDNPLLHLGLETTDTFLHKTDQAIQNLIWLSKQPEITIESKLSNTTKLLSRLGLQVPVRRVLQMISPAIVRQLHSGKPSLCLFDLYKLQLALNN